MFFSFIYSVYILVCVVDNLFIKFVANIGTLNYSAGCLCPSSNFKTRPIKLIWKPDVKMM